MTLEQMLTETLHSADDYAPSPDLFTKVKRSIDEDERHRRRVRETLLWLAAGVLGILVYVLVTATVVDDGGIEMSYTSLEILGTLLMIAVVATMGPAIRRFGETYERAVFAGSPETGTQVLRLLDIAYYLIFGAYIVMSLVFEPPPELAVWERQFSDQLFFQAQRLGGLFLVMGVLHVVLLLTLPVIGLVHSANLRRSRMNDGATSTDPFADKIDRGVTIAVWLVALAVLAEMVLLVLGVLAILGTSG